MPEIIVLVGTQTGNAESLAEDLQAAMEANCDASVAIKMMDKLKADVFQEGNIFLFCSSTWGDGELPDNAIDFHKSIVEQKPPLAGKKYGFCALGDHDYDPYFCEAAKIFGKAIESLGAKKVIDTYEINQGPTDDDIMGAMRWSLEFVKKSRG
jgi:MioC protein